MPYFRGVNIFSSNFGVSLRQIVIPKNPKRLNGGAIKTNGF